MYEANIPEGKLVSNYFVRGFCILIYRLETLIDLHLTSCLYIFTRGPSHSAATNTNIFMVRTGRGTKFIVGSLQSPVDNHYLLEGENKFGKLGFYWAWLLCPAHNSVASFALFSVPALSAHNLDRKTQITDCWFTGKDNNNNKVSQKLVASNLGRLCQKWPVRRCECHNTWPARNLSVTFFSPTCHLSLSWKLSHNSRWIWNEWKNAVFLWINICLTKAGVSYVNCLRSTKASECRALH